MSPIIRVSSLAVFILALAACGDSSPPPPSAQTPAAGAAPATPVDAPEEAPAVPAETVEQLLARANAALAADRLFEPAGDNALELYLAAIERAEADTAGVDAADKPSRRLSDAMTYGDLVTQTRLAVTDILPYGLVWVERAINADSRPEAARVLALLERAQPGAASLQRLREQLNEAETRAERALADAAAREAAAAAAAAAPPPEPEPAPAPPPVAAQPAPAAAPPPASTTPATPTTTQPTAAPAAAATQPAVLPEGAKPRLISQPPLRYPPQALRRGTEGFVQVSFTIAPDGSTSDVRVIRASPRGLFDNEAIRVVSGLKFQPPGRSIASEQRIDFKLD
jgi:protein TonB